MNLPPLPKPRWTPLERTLGYAFSEDQMREYGEACRKQALEEAAQKCDEEFFNATKRDGASAGVAAGNCAEAIRSMK